MGIDTTSEEYQSAKAAKDTLSQQLFASPARVEFQSFAAATPSVSSNVVGIGVGPRESGGESTDELAIKVFVERKFAPDEIDEADMLPETMNGIQVDVLESGRFVRQLLPNPKKRIRPIQPGSSVGFAAPGNAFLMAGTFGALVKRDNAKFVLSNNHVLADENALPIGSAIFQPGLLDGGQNPSDQIAHLTQFIPLALLGNSVDAAIAEVEPNVATSNAILKIGAPYGATPAVPEMKVQKFGRTTSYTTGKIISIDTDVKVGYGIGTLAFNDQIIIEGDSGSFSAAGDSGSLIVDMDKRAVGLLFAGSSQYTIANHIGDVLAALNVQLA